MKKGEFLLSLRKKHKASRAKFAELLDVSPSSIEKAEKELIPVTPENKYVKAVCALEGLDNNIFQFDDINEDLLKEYQLTHFSQTFRRFTYFYYGDFWNEDIDNIFFEHIEFTLLNFLDDMEWEDALNYSIRKNIGSLKHYIHSNFLDAVFGKEPKRLLIEILLILSIKIVNKISPLVSQFEDEENEYINFLNSNEKFNNLMSELHTEFKQAVFYSFKKQTVINILSDLEDIGLPLTVENIKKLKKQKELEKIKDEVIPAPTDPKDKQICELLQYAPPAFKDKIIEKLLKFKDEVEDI